MVVGGGVTAAGAAVVVVLLVVVEHGRTTWWLMVRSSGRGAAVMVERRKVIVEKLGRRRGQWLSVLKAAIQPCIEVLLHNVIVDGQMIGGGGCGDALRCGRLGFGLFTRGRWWIAL